LPQLGAMDVVWSRRPKGIPRMVRSECSPEPPGRRAAKVGRIRRRARSARSDARGGQRPSRDPPNADARECPAKREPVKSPRTFEGDLGMRLPIVRLPIKGTLALSDSPAHPIIRAAVTAPGA
jgi:hypothetical protein